MVIGRLAKAAYRTITDPSYRSYLSQRKVESIAERERLAKQVIARLPANDRPHSPDGEALAEEGQLMLPGLITADEAREMREWFETRLSFDTFRPEFGQFLAPANAPAETHVANFEHDSVALAPHALRIVNDPKILSAVSQVLGAKPTISYMAAWWSLPGHDEGEEAQLFHRDFDDYRFVKLFVYLTDVDEESGPHVFVRGSHKNPALVARRRFTEEEVAANYPLDSQLVMTGGAATAFLENTFGLHRGFPPLSKPRLIFQALYSLSPYVGGTPEPVATADRASVDPYINRIYYRFD